MLGDGFINSHFLGVFLECTFFAVIMSTIHRPLKKMWAQKKIVDPGHIMLYAISTHQSFFFFRGFFSKSVWRLSILPLIFYSLSRSKFLNRGLQLGNLS